MGHSGWSLRVLICCILVGGMLRGGRGQVSDSLVWKADSLYKIHAAEKALTVYQDIFVADSTHFTALWRSSLLCSRIGFNSEKEQERDQYYKRAEMLAKRALELRPEDGHSHFVMGVAKGRKALVAGPRDRVAASRKIKYHAERALKADTNHAGAHHLLGRWHLEVTNLNFAERMAANWLFGGLPDGASLDKAIQHLQRAGELKPDFVLYWYDLGRAYHHKGNRQKALKSLQKALAITPELPSERDYKKKAKQLYDTLQ